MSLDYAAQLAHLQRGLVVIAEQRFAHLQRSGVLFFAHFSLSFCFFSPSAACLN
jgi:hypothetical protein